MDPEDQPIVKFLAASRMQTNSYLLRLRDAALANNIQLIKTLSNEFYQETNTTRRIISDYAARLRNLKKEYTHDPNTLEVLTNIETQVLEFGRNLAEAIASVDAVIEPALKDNAGYEEGEEWKKS